MVGEKLFKGLFATVFIAALAAGVFLNVDTAHMSPAFAVTPSPVPTPSYIPPTPIPPDFVPVTLPYLNNVEIKALYKWGQVDLFNYLTANVGSALTDVLGTSPIVVTTAGSTRTVTCPTCATTSSGSVNLQGTTPGTAQTGNDNISGVRISGTLYQDGVSGVDAFPAYKWGSSVGAFGQMGARSGVSSRGVECDFFLSANNSSGQQFCLDNAGGSASVTGTFWAQAYKSNSFASANLNVCTRADSPDPSLFTDCTGTNAAYLSAAFSGAIPITLNGTGSNAITSATATSTLIPFEFNATAATANGSILGDFESNGTPIVKFTYNSSPSVGTVQVLNSAGTFSQFNARGNFSTAGVTNTLFGFGIVGVANLIAFDNTGAAGFPKNIQTLTSVIAGQATAPTCVAGDVCASRSANTGAMNLGGSSSNCVLDYGVTLASTLNIGCPAMINGNLTLPQNGSSSFSFVLSNGVGSDIMTTNSSNQWALGWNGTNLLTYDPSGNLVAGASIGIGVGAVQGKIVAFVAGSCTASVTGTACTFPGGVTFPNTSYNCSLGDQGGTPIAVSYTITSTTQITIFSASLTPTTSYVCAE